MFSALKSHGKGRRELLSRALIKGECTGQPLRGLKSKNDFAKRTQIEKFLTAYQSARNTKSCAKLAQKKEPKTNPI
jgi:hypothetical protein